MQLILMGVLNPFGITDVAMASIQIMSICLSNAFESEGIMGFSNFQYHIYTARTLSMCISLTRDSVGSHRLCTTQSEHFHFFFLDQIKAIACARFDNYEKRSNFHIFKWMCTATTSGIPYNSMRYIIKYISNICKFLIHFCVEWFPPSLSVYSFLSLSLSVYCTVCCRIFACLNAHLFLSVFTVNGKIDSARFVPHFSGYCWLLVCSPHSESCECVDLTRQIARVPPATHSCCA